MEEAAILAWAKENQLWLPEARFIVTYAPSYIAEGSEQKVYLNPDGKTVTKRNTGCYHSTWLEFFLRLIVHQATFPSTAYTVTGFTETEGQLCVIVQQAWFNVDRGAPEEETDAFLSQYGFVNLEYNEFYSKEHGIILDDLHDENVLMGNEDNLVVIDPIIYLETPEMRLGGKSLFHFPYET
ncbi:MAG TPA: hypothetical protein VM871_11485 [Flavisolibacter sp.]|nr:hypothetical protein [Flavisolibacter sp.]